MKVVIDIPKEMIISIEQGSFGAKYNMYDIVGCVMNGTPLPEHHGRLIDADAIEYTHTVARCLEDGHNWNELCVTKNDLYDAPTIIEGSDGE